MSGMPAALAISLRPWGSRCPLVTKTAGIGKEKNSSRIRFRSAGGSDERYVIGFAQHLKSAR